MTPEQLKPAILSLEWKSNKAFQYAEGINTQYEYWYDEGRYAVIQHGYAKNQNIGILQAESEAQADHEKNVLALFDLSLITSEKPTEV